MTQANTNTTIAKESSWWLRNMIALIITGAVLGITVFIGFYTLINPQYQSNGKADLSFIGQTLLPLWGTWMGTVLAFYFGKANFEAASKSYQEVIRKLSPDEKIAKLSVKNEMLPLSQIEYLDFSTEIHKQISEILKYPRFAKFNRFAVLDQSKTLKCMIHRSTFHEFLYQKINDSNYVNNTTEINKLTLENILNESDEKIKNLINRGYGFVPLQACLLDAKQIMDSIAECQDVFVTQNGKSNEPIIGLITNNLIIEKAKL